MEAASERKGDVMELKKIQYFLAIAESGSLTKAAKHLYLTQPTLSRFLAKLEEEAGTKLFLRKKDSSLELTECGRKYLETARKIEALWEQLQEDLDSCKSSCGEKKTILLGINGDYLYPAVSACVEKVAARYSEAAIQISCYGSGEIQQRVAEGDLDLGFCAYGEMDDRLIYTCVNRAEMNLVVSKNNPLAAHSYLLPGMENHRFSLNELDKDAPFALMGAPTVLRQGEDQYMRKMKYEPNVKQIYMRHGSVASIIAASDELIGFCPCDNISDRLAYIALDPPFFYTRGICCRRDMSLSPAEQMLIRLIKELHQQRFL